jgi:hypothetical protein
VRFGDAEAVVLPWELGPAPAAPESSEPALAA